MDTPATESTGPISVSDAASGFAAMLDPQPVENDDEQRPVEAAKEPTPSDTKPEAPDDATDTNDDAEQTFTVTVDGKEVQLTAAQVAEAYKSGLRQADYTKKTMETAEQRKAADAEASKARAEREQYAAGLAQARAVLQAQLQEQGQIDWQKLIETDPQEYLKQQHLAQTRQAQLQRVHAEQQALSARQQAEQAAQQQSYLQTQQQELLAKLPEWKDESKAKADREAIKDYLKAQGLNDAELGNITDHRVVLISRKAMLYDQMLAKAKETAKKVDALPKKVERPGGGESTGLDRRTATYQQFAKTGSVRDAANVFASIL